MTKIIGIDLDEVLAETVDKLLEDNNFIINGVFIQKDLIVDYNIDFHNGSKNIGENSYFYKVYKNDFDELKIKASFGSLDKLKELKGNGYILKIISARPTDVEEYTLKWLDKYFFGIFDSVHFANHFTYFGHKKPKRNKSEICKELGVNLMIEDNPDYALELAQNGIYTFLLEKPWNKHLNISHENIKRVSSWDEINI